MIHQTILLHASCLHAWSAQEFAIALTKNAAIGASWVYGVKKHIIIFFKLCLKQPLDRSKVYPEP